MRQIEFLQYLKRIDNNDPQLEMKVENLYLEFLADKARREIEWLRKRK